MARRMPITAYAPPVCNPEADPDLPPLPELPGPNGQLADRCVGKRVWVDGWNVASVHEFARTYARLTLKAERERVAALNPQPLEWSL